MKIIKKFLYLLSYQERKRAYLLMVMILIMALLDMLGVASIMPFIAILSNPELIETNAMLNKMFKVSGRFGIETNQQFLFLLGIFVFLFLVISLSFRALTHYAQVRFLSLREYSIGKRLVEGYLHQPYSWFLSQNSADIGNTILQEVQEVVSGSLGSFIDLIAKCFVTIFIITLLH